ncbi:MarR family winged helix-turn-helix transcriptional regulator [Pseudonocardia parietis]|uniref:DNA-binding MarR family transcriptional regulator n=1 Tax=Pseudonocardia parietis TaxID=570936 RepID=A0ABS4VLD2_9PSEU|nr:MarR family winged helix-turn-helix transcriptional regulator [Pseudonocardia parietis]MBP2364730.1 DNA-binding MarR family transcriptional regulator [Pseudonocardia parietis]
MPPADPATEPDEADLELADTVVRELFLLIRQVKRSTERHRPEMIVDMAGYHVLAHLHFAGPQRATEVAATFHADPSTISRQVSPLVKAGLVERRADPADGRAALLAATDDGVLVIESERRRRTRVIARVLGAWEPGDRTALATLLDRFLVDFQTHETRES